MPPSSTRKQRARRASSYVLVLGVSMIVTVIGLSAVALSRVRLRSQQAGAEVGHAAVIAFSGVEHAMQHMASNAGWRALKTHGVPVGPHAFSGGSFTWTPLDEIDGDLTDDPTDPVTLIVDASFKGAAYKTAVMLWFSGPGTPPEIIPGTWERRSGP